MREGHTLAHLREETQTSDDVESMLVAVAVDGLTLHVLHNQVGLPQLGDAAIEKARQRRVFEGRQDLPLGLEASHQRWIRQPQVHDLDGDTLAELIVGTVGFVDRRHAAAGHQTVDGVAAQTHAHVGIAGHLDGLETLVLGQQLTDFVRQRSIVTAQRHHLGISSRPGGLDGQSVEQVFQQPPASDIHREL